MYMLLPYKDIMPTIGKDVWIADNASVIGDTVIGDESNIWFGVTIRGDVHEIRIGKRTNIQDHTLIHTTRNVSGAYIGDEVTIGHGAIIHACTIEDQCLVGMGAIILDQAVMEKNSMLAAGSVLPPKKRVPSGQLWGGTPARYMRELTQEEMAFFEISARNYIELSQDYKG